MKKRILAVLALLCLVLMAAYWPGKEKDAFGTADIKAAEEVSRSETEVLAANIQLTAVNGQRTTLQNLYNQKPVCLFFWAPWNGESQKELAALQAVYPQYRQKIQFVPVVLEGDQDQAQAFYQQTACPLPLYMVSPEAADDENVSSLPHLFFICRGGRISEQTTEILTEKQLEYALAAIR